MNRNGVLRNFISCSRQYLIVQTFSIPFGLGMSFLINWIVALFVKRWEYVAISNICSNIFFFITAFAYGVMLFAYAFNHAVKMGSTRRNFLVGAFLSFVASSLFCFLFMFFHKLEVLLVSGLFNSKGEPEVEVFDLTPGTYALLAGVCILLFFVCAIVVAIVKKTGKGGFFVLYFSFIILFNVIASSLGRIIEYIKSNPIGSAVLNVNNAVWIVLGVVIFLAALAFSARVYMKTDIK